MTASPLLLVATGARVHRVDPAEGRIRPGDGLEGRDPTCLARDPEVPLRAWCGTRRAGVFRTDDGGAARRASGLEGAHVTALATDPSGGGLVWAGTEPSAVWHSPDGGARWERLEGLGDLPSSGEWPFPPKPATHHVRWIAPLLRAWGVPGELWAGDERGIHRSRDGGRTPERVAAFPERPANLRGLVVLGEAGRRDRG